MTIINSLVQGEKAYLLADMAWIDQATGRLIACQSKFLVGTNFPWAIAVTGDGYTGELMNQINWRAPQNAEELAEGLPLLLRGLQGLSLDPGFTMALRLAAWCERTATARIFHVDMDAARCARFGIEPWEVVEAYVLIPGDNIAEALPDIRLDDPLSLMDPSAFDPEKDGLRIVAAQRDNIRFPLKGKGKPMSLIGGGAQLACVSRDGVDVKTLHVWSEDRVGELINPVAQFAGVS
jgi:hypothetical protein